MEAMSEVDDYANGVVNGTTAAAIQGESIGLSNANPDTRH